MDQLTFDVNVAKDGRYVARARENDIAADGASFEEMQAKATGLTKAHFATANPPPKIVRIAFEQVLSLS